MPLLSICIPTKNRDKFLKVTLDRIVRSEEFLNSNDIEIVVSDNCSDDGTQTICEKYAEKYGSKFLYKRQETDIQDKNFTEVLHLARGKFAKLNNDTLWFPDGSLSRMLEVIRENQDAGLIFFHNSSDKDKKVVRCKDATEFFLETKFYNTWIGGICVNSEIYKTIENVNEYSGTSFTQVAVCAKLASVAPSAVVYGDFMKIQKINKKGSYNIAQIFGNNYLTVIKKLEKEGLITDEVYKELLKPLLVNHINPFYFNLNDEYGFVKTGYFKYLFKYYKKFPYFYKSYLKYWLKSLSRKVLSVRKEEYHRKYTLLGVIKFSVKRKNLTEKYWRKNNRHNNIFLKNYNNADKVTAGNHSYGEIDVLFDGEQDCHLYIGNYVSIADGVRFIASSEHDYKNISTFPFKFHCINGEKEALTKGDIIIRDDVWIGMNALILSGVTINQGAVIAAGSVVTKDVPPYAIVGGNPAKVIKYRFSPEIIEKLKKVDYSKLTDEAIKANISKLYTAVDDNNVDEIIEALHV